MLRWRALKHIDRPPTDGRRLNSSLSKRLAIFAFAGRKTHFGKREFLTPSPDKECPPCNHLYALLFRHPITPRLYCKRLPVKENHPPPSLRAIHFHLRSTPYILKNYLELTSIINDGFDEVGEVSELQVWGFQIPGGIGVDGLE